MMFPSNQVRIFVVTKPVDFRKGHDGLAALVRNELRKDPLVISPKISGDGFRRSLSYAASMGDLSPKFPPALRGVLGVKSVTLGGHFVHRLSLQEFHWRQVD